MCSAGISAEPVKSLGSGKAFWGRGKEGAASLLFYYAMPVLLR